MLPAAESERRDPLARLEEAVGLARAIDLDVAGAELAPLRRPTPATLLGSGKVEEIKAKLEAEPVELVVVDAALTPVQQRNLEKAWKTKVIDRTGLILEIFGARARTREGVLQVELAALTYQRSRLVRSWTHLERQRGGFGFLGGPGESQLELDRRKITERITRIKAELEEVRRTRGLHRRARERVPYRVVALVGYTNAGKSTLFNRLTGAGVEAVDKLFATLDPTMRLVRLPSGPKIILSDTVGFISDLPTQLVAAFHATLEEVQSADLILHVRDVSNPDHIAQAEDVARVLDELGIDAAERERRLVEVWNKIDRLPPGERALFASEALRRPDVVMVSAATGEGVEALLAAIERRLFEHHELLEVDLPVEAGAALAWLHEHGEVLAREDREDGVHLTVAVPPEARGRLRARLAGAKITPARSRP
ncbi:MAG: GTPase HflX [Geminicoccaceae bacterium]|nr:GTPase HflX [Geminicoccaceae bacterium]MDW8371855.1 GTPase HflX [Geminicoccaceae bacterium]